MNVVDSSAWIEYFTDGKYAQHVVKAVEDTKKLIVPTIVLFEVFKKIMAEKGETMAFQIVAQMKMGTMVDLDLEMALMAASLAKQYKLPMADSIIFATAKKHNATLWTLDDDFENLPGVRYFSKK